MADELNLDVASNSTKFHSTHIESLKAAMEKLDVNDEKAKVRLEIELSKEHWSELASTYDTALEGPVMDSCSTSQREWVNEEGTLEWKQEVAEDNMRVFRSLQEKYPGGFFIDENNNGPDSIQKLPKWMISTCTSVDFWLSSDTPFAEGGQAELFHAHVINMEDGKEDEHWVMKVFKEGTPLRDLLKLFPIAMLSNDQTCIEGYFGSKRRVEGNFGYNLTAIYGARLLKSSGRFAFLMFRAWGDLRKLINERMLHFNTRGQPFEDDVAFYIIRGIAMGMESLHEIDIVHGDLKAANVLIFGKNGDIPFVTSQGLSHLQQRKFDCMVADFECSVGVVGTGFWRAPEILEAVKNRNISQKPELFTKQVDVYSFGMTCYEILSGGMPFEELRARDYGSVIGGARPILPSQTTPWMVDLVNRCWHKDPSMRPPFEEIVKIMEPYVQK